MAQPANGNTSNPGARPRVITKWKRTAPLEGNVKLTRLMTEFAAKEIRWTVEKAKWLLAHQRPDDALIKLISIKLDYGRVPENILTMVSDTIPRAQKIDVKSTAYVFLFNWTRDKTHLWNRARLGAGDAPEKLIPLLDDIILIDPKDENAWFNKANCFMNMQKYPEALEILDGILSRNKRHAAALGHKGLIFLALGKFERAEDLLNQSISIVRNPAYEKARDDAREQYTTRNNMLRQFIRNITTWLEEAQNDRAKHALDQALNDFPRDHTIWTLLGRYYRQMKQLTEASQAYQQAVAYGSFAAQLELANLSKISDVNAHETHLEALQRLDNIHKQRIEAIKITKKQQGIDLLEEARDLSRKRLEVVRNQHEELKKSIGITNRLKVRVGKDEVRAIYLGTPGWSSKLQKWFPSELRLNIFIIIRTLEKDGSRKPSLFKFQDLLSPDFALPQPSPELDVYWSAEQNAQVTRKMTAIELTVPQVTFAISEPKAERKFTQNRRSLTRGNSSPALVAPSNVS